MKEKNESKELIKHIKYKDSTVNYHIMEYKKDFSSHNCLCCNKPINTGTAVLFVNNREYLPNFFAHADCLKPG